MTRRDQYILMVLGAVGLVAAIWFLAIGPKRSELSELSKKVEKSEQDFQTAQKEAQEFAQARMDFPQSYAAMVKLGKAVPTDPDVPSLLVQLEHAADVAGVDFKKVEIQADEGAGETPAAAPAPAPSVSGESGGGAAAPAPGAAPDGGAASSAPPASGSAPAAAGSAPAATGSAPADAVATAAAPIGTSIGSAGFPTMKLALKFEGSFYKLADFIHQVKRLVDKRNKRVVVSGRLISIDGIAFSEAGTGFPRIAASIAATAYLVPSGQGLLAGATPGGPAAGTPATPTPVADSAAAPPTAVVTP